MKRSFVTTSLTAILAAAVLLMAPRTAHATQPLEAFLENARTKAYDAREAVATQKQREGEATLALGRLLPAFTARGVYTRNQYEVAITQPPPPGSTTANTIVITPQDQLDGFLTLDVPLVDVGNYYKYRAAKATARAQTEQVGATGIDLARNVCRAYYNLLGAHGILRASQQSIGAAESNLKNVEVRRSAGTATELDRERARASVERSKQDISDAQLLVELSGRQLETLSGLTPTPAESFPTDDLRAEAPLQEWMNRAGETPQDRAVREATVALNENRKAADAAFIPSLSASAQERFTNATGFSGKTATYLLQLVVNWRLDFTGLGNVDAQNAARDVQAIREERAHRGVQDAVFEAHRRVEAGIVKSKAARAQSEATAHAAELAADRYSAGAATQLDVTQAQRDAFLAEASRIQADADLLFARASLRLAAGAAPTQRRPQ